MLHFLWSSFVKLGNRFACYPRHYILMLGSTRTGAFVEAMFTECIPFDATCERPKPIHSGERL